ncbi:hypothetical protein K8T06_07270, partial [bacterium]|nr:hypothetical protein [bacterium]
YNSPFGEYEKVEWDEYMAIMHVEYPLSTFYRLEMNLGYEQLDYESRNIPEYDSLDRKLMYIQPSFSGDTVR